MTSWIAMMMKMKMKEVMKATTTTKAKAKVKAKKRRMMKAMTTIFQAVRAIVKKNLSLEMWI